MPALIHPQAVVAASAKLAKGVRVGPFAVIEEDVEIGEGTSIAAHAVIKRYTRLGVRLVMTSFFPWIQAGAKELIERAAAGARG